MIKLFKKIISWLAPVRYNFANAWPTTGAGSLASGYLAEGVTTIRWGSGAVVTSVNGTTVNGTTVGIVLRANEKSLVDNIKLPNGDGLTTTRVQIVDGTQWDLTIRDDTGITGRPKIGTTVVVVDMGGLLGTVALKYSATVIETAYDTAPKQPGEFTVSVESLILIESQTGA